MKLGNRRLLIVSVLIIFGVTGSIAYEMVSEEHNRLEILCNDKFARPSVREPGAILYDAEKELTECNIVSISGASRNKVYYFYTAPNFDVIAVRMLGLPVAIFLGILSMIIWVVRGYTKNKK